MSFKNITTLTAMVFALLTLVFGYNAFTTWDEEFQVNTYTSGDQKRPTVAVDNYGNFVITWSSEDQDGSDNGVYAQRFDKTGKQIGEEFQVNTYTNDSQFEPIVLMDAEGNFVIVWSSEDQDGSGKGIFAQRYDKNGLEIGDEFQVNTYTSENQYYHSASMNDSGSFVVTWSSLYQDESQSGVYAQRFDNSGNMIGDEIQVNTYTDNFQNYSFVAINDSGSFIVSWSSQNQDGSQYGVYAQRFDSSGKKIGDEFQVNTYTENTQMLSSVAMNETGDFVIAWQSFGQDGSGYSVNAQRYDSSGNKIGDEFQVNTYTEENQSAPSVVMDNEGNFIIVWVSDDQDGAEQGIFAQKFLSDGSLDGDEFQLNTYTDDVQRYPFIAMNDSGANVIVWESFEQDGSDYGVFARLCESEAESEMLLELYIDPPKNTFYNSESFNLLVELQAPDKNTDIDLYFVLLNGKSNELFFGLQWGKKPSALISNFMLPANFVLEKTALLNIKIPSSNPPINDSAFYTFAIAASKAGSVDFISNIATVSFKVE